VLCTALGTLWYGCTILDIQEVLIFESARSVMTYDPTSPLIQMCASLSVDVLVIVLVSE